MRQPTSPQIIVARVLRTRPWKNLPFLFSALYGAIFWGFLLRVATILVLQTYKFGDVDDNFGFGYETGRIGRAIALGQGFSNPFHGITGPTAWEAPLYPLLVGGVFRLAGIYSYLSAFLLLTINSLVSALTAIPIYFVAKKVLGARRATWCAWTWALLPYTMDAAVRLVWETSLTAFLLATTLWLTLELADANEREMLHLWLWFGFVWGVLALTNPSCLTFLPFSGLWACRQLARRRRRWFISATASALIFVALVTPWEVRNYRVFHQFIPIRSNSGAELRYGNGPEATGICTMWLHPTQNVLPLEKFRRMGEIAYVRLCAQEAVDYMRHNPGRTALLSFAKAIYYWAGVPRKSQIPALAPIKNSLFLATSVLAWLGLGVMIRRREHGRFLFAALLLIYPLTYYVFYAIPRYRQPIEPMILILGIYLISETREVRRLLANKPSTSESYDYGA
jgi:hypothetical protein